MRLLLPALLCSALAAHATTALPLVDLDRPGALAALKRDTPGDYEKVLKAMDEVQAVPLSRRGRHDLRFDPAKPDPTRRHIETSLSAKTHITVFGSAAVYRITVLYTKHPAKVVPAEGGAPGKQP